MNKVINITLEVYEKAIPSSCSLKTYELHADELMLCLGLINSIKVGKIHNCGICEYSVENFNS